MKISSEKENFQTTLDSLSPIKTFKNFKALEAESNALLIQLQELGFLESKIENFKSENDSTYQAKYYLGNQWKWIKIYYNSESFSKTELQAVSKEITPTYFTIPITQTKKTLQYLNVIVTKKGAPFARLQLKNIQKIDNITISALLQSVSGKERKIDDIIIKGYDKFPKSQLTYYAGIKKGDVFDQEKISKQNELLNNLGFVNTLKPPEVLFEKDSTTVYFYLEKRNNNLFDGILGFNTNEDTQRLEFNGYLNLELNNNLNYGEQLLVNYKADGREQLNFRARTHLPYLFNSPFGISLELKIFKRDSTFTTTDQQARVSYQVNPNLSIYTGYKSYESSNLLDEIIAGSAVVDYNSNYILAGGSFQNNQISRFFPIKTLISVESEIGKRSNEGNEEEQFRIQSTLSHIFNLNSKNSIYLNNENSILSSETYLTNELFRFGGINSIRGFSENSIDASLFAVLNTEYRYLFNTNTYIHSIIDLAYFENQTLDLEEELYSFGIGLGLLTKAGILKFNIANGVSNQQNFKFSNTKIHLSLSSRF